MSDICDVSATCLTRGPTCQVLAPIAGFWAPPHITLVFDFESLYPSVMMEINADVAAQIMRAEAEREGVRHVVAPALWKKGWWIAGDGSRREVRTDAHPGELQPSLSYSLSPPPGPGTWCATTRASGR